ncbi:riboflavin kinase [Hansschlegelia sp. KR7-227]|uniref:riboflavin kinase n=1 Tax=Hansschlegelia sp. KR7-227 TaxID=3400914 RepID=UPI003C0AC68A
MTAAAPGVPDFLKNGHVVLDDFDGVHRGHVAAVEHAVRQARLTRCPVVALTCEPPPEGFRLTGRDETARLLVGAGASGVVTLGRDALDCGMASERFVSEVLGRQLSARSVIVRADSALEPLFPGAAALAEIAPRHGIAVHILPSARDPDTSSADLVRKKLAAGDVEAASVLLGRFWSVESVVIHGEKRGRALGVPTANLDPSPPIGLAHGIYAVRALIGTQIHDGVASFGRRPHFDGGAPLLEVHLMDFADDLYGATLRVEFVAFQRGEAAFRTVEALCAQMARDIEDARNALRAANRSTKSALNWTEPLTITALAL